MSRYIVVDVETDGPSPANSSMVCFGAVLVDDHSKTFYGKTKPITTNYFHESLAISGFSREEHEKFDDPSDVMEAFAEWVDGVTDGHPVFISDNNSFDFKWIDYYFWKFHGSNPFGFSSRRIGDLYCGLMKNAGKNSEWKYKFRKTKHNHNPEQDALGNAEALIAFRDELGLKITF